MECLYFSIWHFLKSYFKHLKTVYFFVDEAMKVGQGILKVRSWGSVIDGNTQIVEMFIRNINNFIKECK